MKTAVALIIAIIFTTMISPTAEAITPHGRLVVGVVKNINREKQRAELQPADGTKSFIFAWSNRTTFLRGTQFASPDDLREGLTIQVKRIMPFFGPADATRIIFPEQSAKPKSR